MEDSLPNGSRGSYAHLICSACRARKIKCRLPIAQEEVRPSTSPRPPVEACERCRRLDLPCIVNKPKTKQRTAARRHGPARRSAVDTTAAPDERSFAPVNPRLFDQYYTPSNPSSTATTGTSSQKTPPDASEAFRAMLTSANLMSALLAQDSSFGASSPSFPVPGRLPLTETISNGLATLLDESLVWHRFYLPFLPTLTELRSQLVGGSFTSSSTSLLFALLALCALEHPSSELYWHQDLRQYLQAFVSYHGQEFIYDPPVHRHTVYILHVVITYKPTALIACQQSASAAIRGSTHTMLVYSIAKSCHFGDAATSLANILNRDEVRDDHRAKKVLDVLLWCRTLIHHVLLEGSILKPLSDMQSHLDITDHALEVVHETMLRVSFAAPIIYFFHAVRCVYVEMQHYVRMRKARRDMTVLASIITDHESTCEEQKNEILQQLSAVEPHDATKEEISAAVSLAPMDSDQSRARQFAVAIFFAIMAHMTPSESHDKVSPHEAARMSKLVFNIWRDPASQGLRDFLLHFVALKDTAVHAVLQSFTDAGKTLRLQRMSWLPPARKSSQEILFQCWLIVDQNIARLDEGLGAIPDIEGRLVLLQHSAQTLEALSAPAGGSIDDAFANGSHYAASAKLIRCLHGILSTRVAQQAASRTSAAETSSQPHLTEPGETEQSLPYSADLDLEQVFGEWANWPYNSTWDMLQSLQDNTPE